MNATDSCLQLRTEWGVAARSLPDQTVSGDMHLVNPFAGGLLLAAVDGLGHGEEAAAAAQTAIKVLAAYPAEGVVSLIKRCHSALKSTRGAVMTLASVHGVDGTMSWLGVGNVESVLLRADAHASPASQSVLLRNGLVGYQLPALQASLVPIAPGDLLIFATDGIRFGFTQELVPTDPPQLMADHILNRFFKGTDDALVLVVRYLGARYE